MTDRALREALRQQEEQQPLRLPTNFAYNTMRRIEREQKARERREQAIMVCTVCVVVLLGLSVLLYFHGETILSGLLTMAHQQEGIEMLPGMLFCAVFLTALNIFLSRKYASHPFSHF